MKRIIFIFAAMLIFLLGAAIPKEAEETPAFFKTETIEVPIVMYHLVTKNSRLLGQWSITPTELENDLKWLKDKGYETVVMEDLINFVKKGKNLPDKPIVLSFDDGNSSDYHYLYPLLQKYDMKAVVSVLGKFVDECSELATKADKPKYFPNLTWDQVKELHESKHIELQSHSYNLHGSIGSKKKSGESVEAYHQRLKLDLEKNQNRIKEMTGASPTTFTYPYGMISESSQEALEEFGFKASLGCRVGVNTLTEGDDACLFQLRRADRPHGLGVSDVLQKMYKEKKSP